jgi:hypothetical protein
MSERQRDEGRLMLQPIFSIWLCPFGANGSSCRKDKGGCGNIMCPDFAVPSRP